MKPVCLVMFLAALSSPPAMADETRVAPPGHVPPPAAIESLAWLAGHWEGTGIDGHAAIETYSPPLAGAIVGHFVQTDAQGAIAFSEFVHIVEADGSLVLRLKHFDAGLKGWEEKAEVQSFPLVAIADGAVYFDGLTMRRDGENGLVSAVVFRRGDGSTGELVFRYTKAGPTR
ncbi:hypothetical protein B2G71_13010 [Novosphingobium sp. PC22D]|uniref:DUF6265 family protein n=1 Tax=Novosphingobium sp. PC22D TaxID=1962403 RepID=UPI000BEFC4A3|nr:DUF6265 family protein [Novosphingobium sp. PC22D]PEQ12063.1 hypothetical protein B2G71_13010 [Novosphingobium sp. PC22D]